LLLIGHYVENVGWRSSLHLRGGGAGSCACEELPSV
jgi:hypothetical protein